MLLADGALIKLRKDKFIQENSHRVLPLLAYWRLKISNVLFF